MAQKSAAPAIDDPLMGCESLRPRMAKAKLESVTNGENREEYGRILRRASDLASMNRDQTADALGVDPAQVTRWWGGTENPPTWRYRKHDGLRRALRIAEAEADGDVEVETVIRMKRGGL